MTNNSGKFRTNPVSNLPEDAAADVDVEQTEEKIINLPTLPEDTMSKVRRYLGEWWWLWIVAIVFFIGRK